MSVDMKVSIGGVEFKNPVITASGTFAFGKEYTRYMDIEKLGGIGLKALTREKRLGNPPVRIAETPSGILNSVGLQNPGVDYFVDKMWGELKGYDTVMVANVSGSAIEDYVYVVERLNETQIPIYEINVSCPNVKHGGVNFGTDEDTLANVVKQVRAATKKPIVIKLTPNVTSIAKMARVAQDNGADGVSLINTLTGMAINAKTRKPVLANVTGGLSGPCVKPVALRMVNEVYNAVDIPIIGMGGIMTGEDAAEFMIAGATAVMVGTATVIDPNASERIVGELEDFCREQGIEEASSLTGTLEK